MCSRVWSTRRSLWLVALVGGGCGSKGIDGTPFQHTDSGFPDIQVSEVSSNDTVYAYAETPVELSSLVSGAYELHLTATTLSGAKGTAVRGCRGDSGPTITVSKPANAAACKGSIAAQLTITDAIFAPISGVK